MLGLPHFCFHFPLMVQIYEPGLRILHLCCWILIRIQVFKWVFHKKNRTVASSYLKLIKRYNKQRRIWKLWHSEPQNPGTEPDTTCVFLENAGSISWSRVRNPMPRTKYNGFNGNFNKDSAFCLIFFKNHSCNTTAAQAEAEMEWPNLLRMKTRRLRLVMPCFRYTGLFYLLLVSPMY